MSPWSFVPTFVGIFGVAAAIRNHALASAAFLVDVVLAAFLHVLKGFAEIPLVVGGIVFRSVAVWGRFVESDVHGLVDKVRHAP